MLWGLSLAASCWLEQPSEARGPNAHRSLCVPPPEHSGSSSSPLFGPSLGIRTLSPVKFPFKNQYIPDLHHSASADKSESPRAVLQSPRNRSAVLRHPVHLCARRRPVNSAANGRYCLYRTMHNYTLTPVWIAATPKVRSSHGSRLGTAKPASSIIWLNLACG